MGDAYQLSMDIQMTPEEFEKEVNTLVSEETLHVRAPFVGHPLKCSQYALETLKNSGSIKKLWKKTRRHAFWWQMIPFVKCVCVCNSLAMGTARGESDIDLFIITKKDRMFLARALFSFWMHITGTRRHGNKIKKRFCLSFWISEDGMDMSKIAFKDDIYLHYWLATLKPVYGKETYNTFMNVNKAFLDRFKNRKKSYRKALMRDVPTCTNWRTLWENIFETTKLAPWLEGICRNHQLKRARKRYEKLGKPFGIVITDTMLKFHDNDIRKDISSLLDK